MNVSLQAPSGLVGGGDDACPRCGQRGLRLGREVERLLSRMAARRATEEQRAAVRADLIARHTTAPLVVCDGDSLVAGNGVLTSEAWPSLLWERYGATVDVVNLGIPGRTAQQIRDAGLAPYAALARQASRRVLVLAAGINDLRAGRTPVEVYLNLSEHALAAQAAGWTVVLCTLAPSPDTETTHPGAIAALNALILSEWEGHLADLRLERLGGQEDVLAFGVTFARRAGHEAVRNVDREAGGVAGVSIEQHNLRPGESTSVYVIRRGEAP